MTTLSILLGQAAEGQTVLTAQGALVMVICVGLVLGLFVFCMQRILRDKKPSEHHHAPLEIDTHDTDE